MDSATGRVQVWARVRPPIEQDHGPSTAVECCESTKMVRVRNDAEAVERILNGQAELSSASPEPKEFAFDGVFGEQSAQRDVFMQIGLPVLREALRGINGTVLAYGQTGSGKTHSLLHQSAKGEEAGLLPRLVASLFLMISQDVANVYDIEAAAVQVYNEQVDDLLNSEHQSGIGHNLNVRDGGVVNGLTWIRCTKPDEMLEAFTRARANVVYAETKMNKASSRSHAIFQLRISKRERVFEASKTGQKVECTIARLNVVDLAGSERVKKSGSEGMRFQEATNINRSLLAFGNVVSALAARKSHVPLRDSKLTRILDGSIGGNCRTALLVCVNGSLEHVGETQNTLEFASRAMRVEVDAKVNTALVEVSAKTLLADLNPEAHEFGKKVQADKKEIEALRKQSADAAEQAKREAEKREKAVQEAESNVKKLQQAVWCAAKAEPVARIVAMAVVVVAAPPQPLVRLGDEALAPGAALALRATEAFQSKVTWGGGEGGGGPWAGLTFELVELRIRMEEKEIVCRICSDACQAAVVTIPDAAQTPDS
ncbi:KIN7I [Symbiodinium natans]|uniref:Kinesin-like protein n=1 Tax=Symbiodinium natans TaxID=878477 RepID=A0A812K7N9_9DINO|nr:KIN7I [Symbiodinium natans]